MERILVLGPCGSGKSTLSRRLGPLLGLPVIHLDQEYWNPGWQITPGDEWPAKVEALIAQPRWVMDGNYGSTLAQRLERADSVVILDYPRRVFFWQMVWRSLSQFGRSRPDMAPDCPEQIDLAFWRYTWTYRSNHMPGHEAAVKNAGLPVIRLHNHAEAASWLTSLN